MKFEEPLIPATLIKRYKRFLADVRLEDGQEITVHVANSGSMKGCVGENWPVMISDSHNPKRKLRCSLEMVHNGKCWIGIHTARPNALVEEALGQHVFPGFADWKDWKREVKYGANSRIDLLGRQGEKLCYVEVKNVTLVLDGTYAFPDSVTVRGLKHLHELENMVAAGHRAVMIYVIQRSDGEGFRPAGEIDPAYADGLKHALETGVEALAWRFEVTPDSIEAAEEIKILI